jgi:hypothetical protein
MFHHLNL